MSTEFINRITVKKDGVYISSHSSNDTAPFHSWRCKGLSEIYAAEGQKGLDREIVCMLYIVSKSSYKATLPDESTQMWKNTNAFLDSTSDYYNGNVKGVKTGSLSDDYNLVVLYQQHGKEFLICSLGSKSNSSRYDDVNYIIKTIDESDYLSR